MLEDEFLGLDDVAHELDPTLTERAAGFFYSDGFVKLAAYAPSLSIQALERMDSFFFEVQTPARFRRYNEPLPVDADLWTKKTLIYGKIRGSIIGYFRWIAEENLFDEDSHASGRDLAEILHDLFGQLDGKYEMSDGYRL